jgi:hypothetical protein
VRCEEKETREPKARAFLSFFNSFIRLLSLRYEQKILDW